MLFFSRHRRARNNLSAYIDGELGGGDVRDFEAHLESCASCREELEQMRGTARALRALPEVEPRRSFALTPEMVAEPRPAARRGPSPALVHGTRMAAAGLAAALAIVFVIDVNDSPTGNGDDAGLAPESREETGFDAATPLPGFGDADRVPDAPADGSGGGVGGAGAGAPAPTSVPGDTAADGGGEDAGQDADAGGEALRPGDDRATPRVVAAGPTAPPDAEEPDLTDDMSNGLSGNDEADGTLGSADDGDFDTLLALEIGLGSALALVIAGAVLVSVAARRRGV